MTTQAELIDTFLSGDNVPSTASNIDIITVHGGTKAYLVGGYASENYPGAVYAVREPINQLTAYPDFRYGATYSQTSCLGYAIEDQYYKFERILEQDYQNEYQLDRRQGDGFRDRNRPSTRDFDDLDSKLHG